MWAHNILNILFDFKKNTSETINRSLKKFSSCGAKNLNSVFRTIYNFKLDCNKRIANKLKMRKRKTATTVKYSKILEILSEFENMSADEHIINLCTTLERLGSLWINANHISIVIIIQLWLCASICHYLSLWVKNLTSA